MIKRELMGIKKKQPIKQTKNILGHLHYGYCGCRTFHVHKICALVAIIYPVAGVNMSAADTTKLIKVEMNVRNRVDEGERVLVISRIWNNGAGEGTALMDPELTGGANI